MNNPSRLTLITFFSPGNMFGGEIFNLGPQLMNRTDAPNIILTGQKGIQIAAAQTFDYMIQSVNRRPPDIYAVGALTELPHCIESEEEGLRTMNQLVDAVLRNHDTGGSVLVISDPLLFHLYRSHILHVPFETVALGLPQAFQTAFDARGEFQSCKILPISESTARSSKESIY